MKGLTVFITGVTSGIGQATALRFAADGWNIVGHYNSSADKAKTLCNSIKSLNVKCDLLKANLSKESAVKDIIKKLGQYEIDTIINNAGSYVSSKHFTELTAVDLKETFMVNTFAPILISSYLFKGMKSREFGRIVNISSIAAKYGGSAMSLHYGSSKRALEGLTKTLAREGARFNVLVNTLRPGVIDTDFHKKFPKDMAKRIAMIPLKRMGTPEEVAEMVYYLGSDKNIFITNEVMTIAGGE